MVASSLNDENNIHHNDVIIVMAIDLCIIYMLRIVFSRNYRWLGSPPTVSEDYSASKTQCVRALFLVVIAVRGIVHTSTLMVISFVYTLNDCDVIVMT